MDDPVATARALADEGRWVDARELLAATDQDRLTPSDLELLAIASGLTSRDDAEITAWERAHNAWREAGDLPRASRCAFWLGLNYVNRRVMAPAMGWFQRGLRLLEEADLDCAERHMFGIPMALQQLPRDARGALEAFDQLVDVMVTFDDREAAAFARLGKGQALIRLGNAIEGCQLLDEAMTAAMAGDVNPVGVGIIYCAVILECRRAFDVRRAREWTAQLSAWCDRQQGLVPFQGQCLIHRSEVAQLDGDWDAAMHEAVAACDHLDDPRAEPLLGMALHQRAELHRLRGEFDDAESDYRAAAEHGHRVEPGLQLLQLATGDVAAAEAAMRRALSETQGPVRRGRVLAGYTEIVLAAGDVTAARQAVEELATLGAEAASPLLSASAAHWEAAVLLAENEPGPALERLSVAEDLWRQLGAPWETARVRLLRAKACEQSGDRATADLERAAARRALDALGAVVEVAETRLPLAPEEPPGGLSPREIEVIRLVATGMTNKGIAKALVISEKTVARHLSNIFTKLGVSSRSAATAWAHREGVA